MIMNGSVFMFCRNCGAENPENTGSCAGCGAPAETGPSGESRPSPGVVRAEDGVLRWVYEYSLWKNPVILITVWKVLLLSGGIMALFMFFISLEEGFAEAARLSLTVFAITAGVLTGLLLIAYPFYALVNGGKYCVLFEMDDKGVRHIQLAKQYKKAAVIGILTAMLGAASGNMTAAGAGLLGASKNMQVTTFAKVRLVSVRERRHVIYLNEPLGFNQVYAEPEDFAFVRDHILSRVGDKAKIRR